MAYVDGFVIPVPKDKLSEYKKLAELCRIVWQEHGALASVECVGDDVPYGKLTSFPRAVQAAADEVILFSWIIYESKEARDSCMAKVMADPRMHVAMENPPFDAKRMIAGGFMPIVGL